MAVENIKQSIEEINERKRKLEQKISVPLLIIQVIHWLFTGRREPVTYRIMDKITDKLDNG